MGIFSRRPNKVTDDTSSIGAGSTTTRSSSVKSPLHASTFTSTSIASFSSATLPDINLPPPPEPAQDPVAYLRSIYAVRARSGLVYQQAKRNQLQHFDVDQGKFKETAEYVVSIIKRDYAPNFEDIPAHGRWQHFEVGGRPRITELIESWPRSVDKQERTRRLLDLFVVSVILDAGAGTTWSYKSRESGRTYKRSEGLAVATLEMFKAGVFSGNPDTTAGGNPHQADAAGLKKVTQADLAHWMQVSATNPLAGLEGRAGLISRLGDALASSSKFFGSTARPGNMLDYLLSHPTTMATSVPVITIPTLWTVLIDGLGSVWPPSRTVLDGTSLGDAWPCTAMPTSPPSQPWENIVPFHKLTQWLCYSLMAPMQRIMNAQFAGTELLTGLPEYRNGGLFVDTGLLTLKPADHARGVAAFKANASVKGQPSMEVVPLFPVDDDVIVEWRAVTVGLLDDLLVHVNQLLGLPTGIGGGLSLAQMLEAGSWKGGRELAEVSRPNTKQPPIMIVSDGTVF